MKLRAELNPKCAVPAAPSLLQRQPSKSGCSCAKCKGTLQRYATSSERFVDAPPIVYDTLRNTGRALDGPTRSHFESGLGQDFSAVRVHTGGLAAQSARAVAAQAYTVGNDVVFDEGRFAPHSAAGRRLLGHELAHVAQQRSAAPLPDEGLQVGATHDAHEAAADRAADMVARGMIADVGIAPPGVLRRAPADVPLVSSPLSQTLAGVYLEEGEAITKGNPKLAHVAESYKTNTSTRVRLSADLTSAAKNNSELESAERLKLNVRMRAIRDVLKSLGVPEDVIDLSPATAYSTVAHGQVSVDVSKGGSVASIEPNTPLVLLPKTDPIPNALPAPAAKGLPALDLDLKFGPVTVSLPKEVRAKLPISFRGAKSLTIELNYEIPAKFSFKITLDGMPHVRIALKAGAEVDTKNGSATASAGLVIETVATTYNAADQGETRAKITKAGDALNKAVRELSAAAPEARIEKATDVASALGEIYDAVDKATKKATPVPRAAVEFGYKRLLTPGSEADSKKLPPSDYVGVTGTFHF
jgi:hypothetical protein